MAHISDTCNQLNQRNNSTAPTSFVASINTDKLLLPKQQQQQHLSTLIRNYVPTIATIIQKEEATSNSRHNHDLTDSRIFTESFSNSQISSLWEIYFEHDVWKEMFYYSGSCCNRQTNSNDDDNISEEKIKFSTSLFYAIVWTYDQEPETDGIGRGSDRRYKSHFCLEEDEEADDVDYEAKEIVWMTI